jgi:hypothetical protein
MNSNLPDQPADEADLGHLFKLIGRAFERFFKFVYKIAHQLFLAVVYLTFFVKRHIVILLITGIIGIGLAIVRDEYGAKKYFSTIVIKQNYNTGEHLYNTLGSYSMLIEQKDSIELSTLFGISPSDASRLTLLDVESSLTENQKLKLFDEFTKGLDSALASKQKYKSFVGNLKDYEHSVQKITLESEGKSDFNKIFSQIIENICSSEFFINEQKKDIEDLNNQELALVNSIKESDSLQKVYQEVLKKSVEKAETGETQITFEGSGKDNKTKEFELFQSDLSLRRELVEVNRQREDLAKIIEIVSLQGAKNGVLDNKATILEFDLSRKIAYPLILVLAVLSALLFWEFLKFLERYKERVS